MTDDYKDEHDHDEEEGTFGEWLQENLRIIISILIVALLAMGIYSYSKRTNAPEVALDDDAAEQVVGVDADTDDLVVAQDGTTLGQELEEDIEELAQDSGEVLEDAAEDTKEAGESMLDKVRGGAAKIADRLKSDEEVTMDDAEMEDGTVSSDSSSKETTESFVETAVAGDGVTHLARKATASYLAKNADTTLTGAHKVYIEDYLRKNTATTQNIHPGMTVEFSKDLIAQAVAQSKNLNDAQLQNLQKYARAAGL